MNPRALQSLYNCVPNKIQEHTAAAGGYSFRLCTPGELGVWTRTVAEDQYADYVAGMILFSSALNHHTPSQRDPHTHRLHGRYCVAVSVRHRVEVDGC